MTERTKNRGRTNYWMLILVFPAPTISSAAETEWLVAPYFWLPDVTLGQLSDGAGGGGTVSGSDLLDKIDAAGMIRVEAARGRWGVTLDYIFLALSDEATASLPTPTMARNSRSSCQMRP